MGFRLEVVQDDNGDISWSLQTSRLVTFNDPETNEQRSVSVDSRHESEGPADWAGPADVMRALAQVLTPAQRQALREAARDDAPEPVRSRAFVERHQRALERYQPRRDEAAARTPSLMPEGQP